MKRIVIMAFLLLINFLNFLKAQKKSYEIPGVFSVKIEFKDLIEIYDMIFFYPSPNMYDSAGNYNFLPGVNHEKHKPDLNIFWKEYVTNDGHKLTMKLVIDQRNNYCKTKVVYYCEVSKISDPHQWKRASVMRIANVCDSTAWIEKQKKPDTWSFHSNRPDREWFEIHEGAILNYSFEDLDKWSFGRALIFLDKRAK